MLILIILGLYFLPATIAGMRGHHNFGSIFVLDIFLGWTFFGWVVALAMACSQVHPEVHCSVASVSYDRSSPIILMHESAARWDEFITGFIGLRFLNVTV
jgi:hypothetical protein